MYVFWVRSGQPQVELIRNFTNVVMLPIDTNVSVKPLMNQSNEME
jgi:hypothetical protein